MTSSHDLYQKALQLIPGGVNSPVRACRSVGRDPLFIRRGRGSRIYSEEGDEFLDYVLSWGPLILGHCRPEVLDAARGALEDGPTFGAPCRQELELAQAIIDAVPGVEMVRLVNSGTEASMSALRVARAHTQRTKVLKFTGCYHGHVDSLLAQAGSGVATLALPGTPGVPEDTVQNTLLAPYNDLESAEALFREHGKEIAAVILEPVAGNMGLVPPQADFLQGLRRLTRDYGALLVFDEVITGFRVTFGGAQSYYGVTPDLTCLGKIIGGGFPVGAFGGSAEIMRNLAPCGSVYQAGTLAGNPVAMAAGAATLRILASCDYQGLAERTRRLAAGMQELLLEKGVPVQLNQVESAFTLFFTDRPVTDFDSAKLSDQTLFQQFYAQMLEQGVYLPPSNFECTFTSFAHTEEDVERTLQAVKNVKF
jgi:glutamate-1-semialdehyde 2,1-aminomutase